MHTRHRSHGWDQECIRSIWAALSRTARSLQWQKWEEAESASPTGGAWRGPWTAGSGCNLREPKRRGVCVSDGCLNTQWREGSATEARPAAVTHWACCPFLYWWRWACGRRDAGTRAPTPAAALERTGKGGCCTSVCGFRPCATHNQPRNAQRGEADAACPLQEEQRFRE